MQHIYFYLFQLALELPVKQMIFFSVKFIFLFLLGLFQLKYKYNKNNDSRKSIYYVFNPGVLNVFSGP